MSRRYPAVSGRRQNRNMRIGVLTSGGDAPGLNAVIRAIVLTAERVGGFDFVGFKDGWRGVIEDDTVPLSRHEVKGIS